MRQRRVFTDPEVVDLLRDDPELLAIADAAYATRRRSRRPLVAAAAALAAAAAILVGVVWTGGDATVAQAALTAIGRGPVIHVVARAPLPDDRVVSLSSGQSRPVWVTIETWYDEHTRRLRVRTRHNNVVAGDAVTPVARARQLAPAVALLTLRYRASLEAGSAVIARRGRFGARRVLWISVGSESRGQVIVDGTSYRPLAARAPGGRPRLWRVVAASSTGLEATQFKVRHQTTPISGFVTSAQTTTPAAAARAAGFPGLWARARFRGYRLDMIRVERLSSRTATGRKVMHGLYLRYRRGADVLDVSEALSPELAYQFADGRLTFNRNPIPTSSELDVARVGDLFIGQFRDGGVYVRIRASRSSDVVVAARTLSPLP